MRVFSNKFQYIIFIKLQISSVVYRRPQSHQEAQYTNWAPAPAQPNDDTDHICLWRTYNEYGYGWHVLLLIPGTIMVMAMVKVNNLLFVKLQSNQDKILMLQ